MPLNQVGTVSAPEPRMLTVQVWDKGLVVSTAKAIREAGLGLNPAPDGQMIRIPIPELTSERRTELAKLAHKYAEQARVAVRNVRRDGMEALKKAEKDHKISQDEHRQKSDEVQKLTDRYVKQVDECWPRRKRRSSRSDVDCVSARQCRPDTGSQPCRHHHGRQRPLGEGARPAAGRRPPARRRCGAPRRCAARASSASPMLTLFAFSTENWTRPADEVSDLMGLLRHYLRNEIAELHKNGARLRVIGDREGLAADIVRDIAEAESADPRQHAHRRQSSAQLRRPRRDPAGRAQPGAPRPRPASSRPIASTRLCFGASC